VNGVEPAVNEVPEFTGGVNDDNAPTQPAKPEGEAPAAKPAEQPKTEVKDIQSEIKRLEAEVKKLETNVQDAEANGAEDYIVEGYKGELDKAKAELEEFKSAWLNLVNDKPEFDLSKLNEGKLPESNTENPAPSKPEKPAPEFPIPAKVGTPGNPPRQNSDTTAVNEPALVSTTPAAPGTDVPATPTAETPATSAVTPTVAGTSKDNTYQAPAAKAEDKQELPNTGGKDNTAVASLGFLGLLLGALPFVKRKN
jgi:pspA